MSAFVASPLSVRSWSPSRTYLGNSMDTLWRRIPYIRFLLLFLKPECLSFFFNLKGLSRNMIKLTRTREGTAATHMFSVGLFGSPATQWAAVRIHLWLRFSQGHQELSGKSDENKSFKSNQLAPSIYIMIELCFFSLDQWEIRIHLLWGKCFNIPHHCDPHLNQTKWLNS